MMNGIFGVNKDQQWIHSWLKSISLQVPTPPSFFDTHVVWINHHQNICVVFFIFYSYSDQAVPQFLWKLVEYTSNKTFLVDVICTPTSYKSLVALIKIFLRCFCQGMIKYNAPRFYNRFFKYFKTTLWYTIVSLFINAILLHMFSSFVHTLLPLDTGQIFWSGLPSIYQLRHYHGPYLWLQCCCNLIHCQIFCTIRIK